MSNSYKDPEDNPYFRVGPLRPPGSAIVYQPVPIPASAPRMRQEEGMGTAESPDDSDTELVPVTANPLPEATSYSGRNIMALDRNPPFEFKERPTEGSTLEFDGAGGYVDCGNPLHLQASSVEADGKTLTSLTIEAWVKIQEVSGYRTIVSHALTTEREVFLRVSDGVFEFGAWMAGGAVSSCTAIKPEIRSSPSCKTRKVSYSNVEKVL